MNSRIIDVSALSSDDLERWRALAEDVVEPNVFYEPEFLLPTHRHFGEGRGIRIVVALSPGGSWLAALPFESVPGDTQWPFAHASNAGPSLYEYTSLGTPLLRGDPAESARALLEALVAHRSALGRVFTFHLVTTTRPGGRALLDEIARRRCAVHVWGTSERAAVVAADRRPTSWQDLVSTKRAQVLRRRLRQLRDALGGDEQHPVALVRSSQDVDTYLAFELGSWKGGDDGPAFARRDGGAEWWRTVFEGFSARGDGHLLELAVDGGQTAYMGTFLSSGRSVFCMYDAYAPAFSSFSPGSLGRLLVNEHFSVSGAYDLLDTCMDPSRYPDQTRHFPDRVSTVSLTVALGPWPVHEALRLRTTAGRAVHRLRDRLRQD
ncbi:GNAT family N-acetyltransferase [Oerskovia sp. NPDC060338]|uniref:GNAT family N-acetyltransferase n=1 Tax=Oerskovia sp. NPDC060338 TaxID=3347100 RepID=UPI0036645239